MIRPRLLPVLLFLGSVAFAQKYVITTIAGGEPPPTPAAAKKSSIGDPPRVAVDASGNVYFGGVHSVFKVDASGTLTRVAGNGRAGASGDSGPAVNAQLDSPDGIAVDQTGVVYVTDRAANTIRKFAPGGAISTFAGAGIAGYSGDSGPAASALLRNPAGLAFDAPGNLYVADYGNNCVRRISTGGTISTFAGNCAAGPGYGGDGSPANAALLNGPQGLAVDAGGDLYIADTYNNRVRKVTPDGTITTFAGTGGSTFSGDNQPAASSDVFLPTDVAVDSAGHVYIAEYASGRIRSVVNGNLITVAGSFSGVPPADNVTAISVTLNGPTGLALDGSGNLYFAEGSIGSGSGLGAGDFRIWKVDTNGIFSGYAGDGQNSFSGDGGPAAAAQFNGPAGIALDSAGTLYVADTFNQRIRKITAGGIVTTIAGTGTAGFAGDGGPALQAQLFDPVGVAVDSTGNLFIADSTNNLIRKIYPDGTIGTYAGNGIAAFSGDGGSALQAAVHGPQGLAVDNAGNLYVADTGNHRIRKIDGGGTITTVAGSGAAGFAGDGALAVNAQLNQPSAVAVDGAGNLFIADQGNGRIRRVSAAGVISTVAGNGAVCSGMTCPPGNGGTALNASLDGARGVAVDAAGDIFIADTNHNQVRLVLADGSIGSAAGNGTCCYSGDGGSAAAGQLNQPWGLAVGPRGDVYIADNGNNAIRLLQPGRLRPRMHTDEHR